MSQALLTDALRSEAYRFARNRMAVFWSILFLPLFIILVGTVVQLFTKARMAEMADALPPEMTTSGGPLSTSGPIDLGRELVISAGDFSNPVILLFVLIGAAIVYAGDYRWETWRLTSARNSRLNLMLAKVIVVLGIILVAGLGWLITGQIVELIKAAVFARPLTFSLDSAALGQMGAFLALSVTRILQFTLVGLLTAALTRSLLATLFVPVVVAMGQFFLMQALPLMGLTPGDLQAQLLLPGLAADTLKALIEGGPDAAAAPDGVAGKAVLSLALWCIVPLIGAIAWFSRQDLSKE